MKIAREKHTLREKMFSFFNHYEWLISDGAAILRISHLSFFPSSSQFPQFPMPRQVFVPFYPFSPSLSFLFVILALKHPLSVVPFGPHYQHWLFCCFRNAHECLCFTMIPYYSFFFLTFFPLSPYFLFPDFRSVFPFLSICPPIGHSPPSGLPVTLQSTLINELISTS